MLPALVPPARSAWMASAVSSVSERLPGLRPKPPSAFCCVRSHAPAAAKLSLSMASEFIARMAQQVVRTALNVRVEDDGEKLPSVALPGATSW